MAQRFLESLLFKGRFFLLEFLADLIESRHQFLRFLGEGRGMFWFRNEVRLRFDLQLFRGKFDDELANMDQIPVVESVLDHGVELFVVEESSIAALEIHDDVGIAVTNELGMLSANAAARALQLQLILRISTDQDDIFIHLKDVLPAGRGIFQDF
jgi:hypothetical protein